MSLHSQWEGNLCGTWSTDPDDWKQKIPTNQREDAWEDSGNNNRSEVCKVAKKKKGERGEMQWLQDVHK